MIQTDRNRPMEAFIIGLLVGALIVNVLWEVFHGTPEPDRHALRAAGVYEYCWRVDAYRQSAGEAVRRGHDDYHGIYDRVCPAGDRE